MRTFLEMTIFIILILVIVSWVFSRAQTVHINYVQFFVFHSPEEFKYLSVSLFPIFTYLQSLVLPRKSAYLSQFRTLPHDNVQLQRRLRIIFPISELSAFEAHTHRLCHIIYHVCDVRGIMDSQVVRLSYFVDFPQPQL